MNNKTHALIFSALGIVLNIVLGTMVASFKIPLLFLDTVGTIFVAAVLGPFYGALAGGLTNLIQGMITNPRTIPFALWRRNSSHFCLVTAEWKINFHCCFYTTNLW